MKINLETAVARLFPSHSLDMVYVEAVANALDADASEIEISLVYKDRDFSEFKITDNGIGLNKERFYQFSNLMETKDSNHKGQGRLVYLHYFNHVLFESTYKENSNDTKKIRFDFNYNFKEETTEITIADKQNTGTVISFTGFTKERVKRKNDLSARKIKEVLLAEFLPCFQKIKEDKNKTFTIKIFSNVDEAFTQTNISEKDIPEFEFIQIEPKFLNEISQSLSKTIESDLFRDPLTLYFDVKQSNNQSSIVTSFAVDNRAIPVQIIDESNYLENIEAIFFMSSKGFDGIVDGTRKELTISSSDKKKIKRVFKEKMTAILNDRVPQFTQKKEEQKQFFEDKYPHLHGYLPLEDVGFASKGDILNKARDEFFDDQREILEKEHLNDADYQKALELSSRNLAEYVIFRQKQIDRLKTIKKEDREEVIHNLISPKRDTDTQENLNIFRNNAWVLDDRFMTFSHSFSEMELSKVTDISVFEEKSKSNTRPDFLMLFSKPIERNPDEVDIVIFEFKRLGLNVHRKSDAMTELLQYAREIKKVYNEKTKVGRIWLYALVDIDDSFRETLSDSDFKNRFTVSGEVWYRYYENRNVELSFLDFNALVSDADTRNRTFMDILRHRFID